MLRNKAPPSLHPSSPNMHRPQVLWVSRKECVYFLLVTAWGPPRAVPPLTVVWAEAESRGDWGPSWLLGRGRPLCPCCLAARSQVPVAPSPVSHPLCGNKDNTCHPFTIDELREWMRLQEDKQRILISLSTAQRTEAWSSFSLCYPSPSHAQGSCSLYSSTPSFPPS